MSDNELMSTQIRLAYKDQLKGILTARDTSWDQLLEEEQNQIMNFYIYKYNKSGGKDGEHLAFPSEEEIHDFLNKHSIGDPVEIPKKEIVNVKDVNPLLKKSVSFKEGGRRRKRKKKRSKRKRRTKKRKNKSTKKRRRKKSTKNRKNK